MLDGVLAGPQRCVHDSYQIKINSSYTAVMLMPHHTLDELEMLYKNAKRPTERTRWQVIWLKKKGKKTSEIAECIGYHRDTVGRIISKYNAIGADSIADKRQFNHSETVLNEEQQAQLLKALSKKRDDNGLWTSEKVRIYVKENFDIDITTPCAWGYFKRLGFNLKLPRPKRVSSASEEQKEHFKKSRNDAQDRQSGLS